MADSRDAQQIAKTATGSTILTKDDREPNQEKSGLKNDSRESGEGVENFRINESLAYDSPEMLARYDSETAKIVARFERVVTSAEVEYEDAKTMAKEAKDRLEKKVLELRELIRDRAEQRAKPDQHSLFGDSSDQHSEEGLTDSPDTDLPPSEWKPATKTEKEDETWKQVPLSSLSLKPGILKKLASPVHKDRGPMSPIVTLGDLTRYQEPEPNGYIKRLTDIKGIGATAADEIGEACMQYWAERQASR